MGVAFAAVVNSLVNNLLMPVVAMIIGKPELPRPDFTINDSGVPLRGVPHGRDPVRRDRRRGSSSSS
jgi:large-conductance mechanosensitive channel